MFCVAFKLALCMQDDELVCVRLVAYAPEISLLFI